MAYVADQIDQNQQQAPNAQNNPMAQAPSTSSGGVGTTAANSAPAGSPQGAAAVPTSTQAPPVQNLQAYLQANQPQAVQMGNTIAGNLQNTVNQTTGDINAAQTDLSGQVAAQNTAPNTDLVNQAAANPAQFVQNPQNLTDFLAQENANYGGPANFAATPYAQNLQNEVTSAVGKAPDINKPGGVEQLVTGQETNPTLGMRNLDTLLLNGTPGAMKPIQDVIPKFGQLQGQLGNVQTSTDAAIQQAIANDQAAKAGVQNTFLTGPNAVVPTWETALQSAEKAATDKYNTAGQNFNALTGVMNASDLSKLTPEQIASMGLTPELGSQLQNFYSAYSNLPITNTGYTGSAPNSPVNTSNFYTPGTLPAQAPSMAQTATPEDYAKEAALEQLLGGNFTPYLNTANASQSGTAGNIVNPKLDVSGLVNKYANPLMTSGVYTPSWTSQPTNPNFWAGYSDAAKMQILDTILANEGKTQYGGQSYPQLGFANEAPAQYEPQIGSEIKALDPLTPYLSATNGTGVKFDDRGRWSPG